MKTFWNRPFTKSDSSWIVAVARRMTFLSCRGARGSERLRQKSEGPLAHSFMPGRKSIGFLRNYVLRWTAHFPDKPFRPLVLSIYRNATIKICRATESQHKNNHTESPERTGLVAVCREEIRAQVSYSVVQKYHDCI